MKVFAAAMAVLLLVATCSLAEADPGDSSVGGPLQLQDNISIGCCVRYVSRPFPRKMIVSAQRTSSSCPNPGVILGTRTGMIVCVNPETHWVQQYLRDLQILKY